MARLRCFLCLNVSSFSGDYIKIELRSTRASTITVGEATAKYCSYHHVGNIFDQAKTVTRSWTWTGQELQTKIMGFDFYTACVSILSARED